jgi:hypothetical protein
VIISEEPQNREGKEDGPMKKVMTMFVALSFLVSISAVSPSFAKAAGQTTPAPNQQPAQTTANQSSTQQPPITPASKVHQLPKLKFWGLSVDHCVANGAFQLSNSASNTFNVKVGQPVTIVCYYKIKTIPINDITEADVAYWGSGKPYTIAASIVNASANVNASFKKEETRSLPKFTWLDVQHWKKSGGANNPFKIWTEYMTITWSPSLLNIGTNLFGFGVDTKNTIEEFDGHANNGFTGGITVNP